MMITLYDYVVEYQKGNIDIFRFANVRRNKNITIVLSLNTGQLFVDVLKDGEIWYTVRIDTDCFIYCEDETHFSFTIVDHLNRVATQICGDFGDIF